MATIAEIVPSDVRLNPWLLFHGTSNIYEPAIVREGLQPNRSQFTAKNLQDVVAIFDRLKWAGEHGGGLPILKPFSLDHDFGQVRGKPLFLAETAKRGLAFATEDFAGGEVCRALHYCFEELHRYVEDPETRKRHRDLCKRVPPPLRREYADLPPVEWVRSAVSQLDSLKTKVRELRSSFEYGLLYAIELDREDLADLHKTRNMGIHCYRPIKATEIVGRFEVPPGFEPVWHATDNDPLRAITKEGIVMTLRPRT